LQKSKYVGGKHDTKYETGNKKFLQNYDIKCFVELNNVEGYKNKLILNG